MSALSDHITSQLDIIDIIGRYVSLKKSGSNYSGLCPFHSEKTPSFLVSPSKQIYKCFGCGRGGNLIGFIMEIERLDYGDAIRLLTEQYHIDLTDFESKRQSSPEYKSEKEKIKRLMKVAQQYFVDQLEKNTPQSSSTASSSTASVMDYLLLQRGLSLDLITQVGFGYAPESSQLFLTTMQSQGFSLEDLIESGLARQGDHGLYAFFRDRIVIPIRDQFANIIGFGARALHQGQEPKYLNSPETLIYDKSKILYGLDRIKSSVKDHHALVVVEGYFDVIAFQAIGMPIAVATCGTALTHEHIKILRRYHDNIYLLFDSDSAGQNATLRALSLAYSVGVYPKVMSLNTGKEDSPSKDIDEFVHSHTEALEKVKTLLQESQDGFVWALDYFSREYDNHSPVGRQKILNGLFDLVYETTTLSVQNLFLEQIAHHLRSDYALIISQYRRYVKSEKKLFGQQHKKTEQREEIITQRHIQRQLLLGALMYQDYRKELGIDAEWIDILSQFLDIVNFSTPDSHAHDFQERQLRRENELSDTPTSQRLVKVKQIISSQLQLLQKNALKSLNTDAKKQLVHLLDSLR